MTLPQVGKTIVIQRNRVDWTALIQNAALRSLRHPYFILSVVGSVVPVPADLHLAECMRFSSHISDVYHTCIS